ncbi:hypothetical protein UMC2_34981 [[Clostridium] sordellii]|uniref:hypothetical protein n=1 Tax=Paraclostridium sordellii TaxID=1505 RepID=UPI000542208F|nr:hypothetical protein [Paeniclostridium sordellii]CEK34287.1 hypothetical protein UMC2_34981 [[Clostridium] sordellii] [Paeniclostridium sordellii]
MEIINFILSQCISFLVGILSGLATNYIDDKVKNHSSRPTKSGLELDIKIKFKIFK